VIVAPIELGDAGTYTVEVQDANQCNTAIATSVVTVHAFVSTTQLANKEACEGSDQDITLGPTTPTGTPPFTYVWKQDGIVIPGQTGNDCVIVAPIELGDAGTYTVEVQDANQCNTAIATAVVTVFPKVVVDQPGNKSVCEGTEGLFKVAQVNPTGTPPFTYTWFKDNVLQPGQTGNCFEIMGPIELSDAGVYKVEVQDANECNTAMASMTLTVDAMTAATALVDSFMNCQGANVSFSTMASGEGPFTYVWTKDGVELPETSDTLSLTNVQLADSGTYCVEVTGKCNTVSRCAELEVVVCSDVFCSFTQGFYGNPGGTFNGQTTAQVVQAAMSTDLTVGKLGARSFTIPSAAYLCIIERLPSGGTPMTLPNFGDQTMIGQPTCNSPSPVPLSNEKFTNILLGQTITLSLNVRVDTDLADLEVCNIMVTCLVAPGPDGLLGTTDDVPDPGPDGIFHTADDQLTVTISKKVTDALASLGLLKTVTGLIELANCALANQPTGGASLSEVNGAVDAINRGFDECRLLFSCTDL
jgi:hypothetical protein